MRNSKKIEKLSDELSRARDSINSLQYKVDQLEEHDKGGHKVSQEIARVLGMKWEQVAVVKTNCYAQKRAELEWKLVKIKK